jgi:ATP-dependent DNA helicase RecG
MAVRFDTPAQFVKGVGPQRARMLTNAGINTAEDLLKYRPFRYEDRTHFREIQELTPGNEMVIKGTVSYAGGFSTPRRRLKIFEILVGDDSGVIPAKFFNQPYLSKVFSRGQQVILYGAPRMDSYSQGLAFVNPEYEILSPGSDLTVHTGRIVPIYRRLGKLTTRSLRHIVFNLLQNLGESEYDPLPEKILDKFEFPRRLDAFKQIHFPRCPHEQDVEAFIKELQAWRTSAQQRFIFEEFFFFQLGLQIVRRKREVEAKTRKIRISKHIRDRIKQILPFHPTGAQKKVLKEIVNDLCSNQVMSRLLQGDVGSGKTVVAIQAFVTMVENGYQSALMAPTEILAEQHLRTVRSFLQGTPYRVSYLSNKVKGKERKTVLAQTKSGKTDLLVGTHALIQEGVEFKDLGLVIIDEQHRFGVLQRSQLMEKGGRPDTLVMTATPIPRSLALTVYGDLDLSLLDELPPGRKPVKTVLKAEKSRDEVYSVIRREVEQGRQAYIVYPLVEESEKLDLRAATEMSQHLQLEVFPRRRVGLMHGRLSSSEKDQLMDRFIEGKIDVLVSTTVIEVGIDVPNATLMVIEHAERFGLSQLHQLRGRIGRGSHESLCILMVDRVKSREAYERLDIMRKTSDGFEIAERDLEIRGPGEFVGTRQSGLPDFRFGNIVRDRKLLELARQEAGRFLKSLVRSAQDPRREIIRIADEWRHHYGLYEIG